LGIGFAGLGACGIGAAAAAAAAAAATAAFRVELLAFGFRRVCDGCRGVRFAVGRSGLGGWNRRDGSSGLGRLGNKVRRDCSRANCGRRRGAVQPLSLQALSFGRRVFAAAIAAAAVAWAAARLGGITAFFAFGSKRGLPFGCGRGAGICRLGFAAPAVTALRAAYFFYAFWCVGAAAASAAALAVALAIAALTAFAPVALASIAAASV
jgi:hypothetical protein